MLCIGYLQGVDIDATPDPPSLSVKLCSRTSKSLSLGGCWRPLFHVLTVNFSGIKWAFALCSIHILFNCNKFKKFCMSCACRRSKPKNGPKRRRSRPPSLDSAGRPDTSTYMGASLLQEQRDMLTMLLNQGLAPDSVGGPGRHGH